MSKELKLPIVLFFIYIFAMLGVAIALIFYGHWVMGIILAILAISSKLTITEGNNKNDPS